MHRVLASVAVAGSVWAAAAAPAHAGPLSGTKRCAGAQYVIHLRVKNMTCSKGRAVARHWETKGRGHCPSGYSFANVHAGRTTYLSCRRGTARVLWQEGGD